MTEENQLDILILGASLGTDIACLTAIGPAFTSFELPIDVRKITVSNNNSTDEYSIETNKESVVVTAETSSFSKFTATQYHQSPENSFAFLCETIKEDSTICDTFAEILNNYPALEEFSFPEEGIAMYPNNIPSHLYKIYQDFHSERYNSFNEFLHSVIPNYYAPNRYYYYENTKDLDAIGDLLKSYYDSLENQRGVNLNLINWDSQRFLNDKRIK